VVSEAQRRFMQAAEHNPNFAAKAGITSAQAAEFIQSTPANQKLPERKKPRPKLQRRIVRG
jgi:endonuclease V-like protein UPF0215 family